jgi:hypothetical protein
MVGEKLHTRVHPAIRSEIEKLDALIENPRGIFVDQPLLHASLAAQRDFVASREQLFAYNIQNPQMLKKFMRIEGWETADALYHSVIKGPSLVNGEVSREGIDWAIFGSMYAGLRMIEGKDLSKGESAEMALGLASLHLLEKIFPHVHFQGELARKIAINTLNYPIRPHVGWKDATQSELAAMHKSHSRPRVKELRATMPGGKRILAPIVTQAIESAQEIPPPLEGVGDRYLAAYGGVIEVLRMIEAGNSNSTLSNSLV